VPTFGLGFGPKNDMTIAFGAAEYNRIRQGPKLDLKKQYTNPASGTRAQDELELRVESELL
jgi:hypothetical protein